jgi:isopenicillin-N epimerase
MCNRPSLASQFLLNPAVTYLNHGSFGATPRPIFQAYQQWQLELERQPAEFIGRRATSLLNHSRAVLASYLGTHKNNLVYVPNTTVGLNIIARSLSLNPGDVIVSTDHEYGAMDRLWTYLSEKIGVTYQPIEIPLPVTSPDQMIEDFWQNVPDNTRIIFISHITSPTALIFPVKQICELARANNIITIIDGAHAPGQIDLDLEEIGADFYVGNLHKWLCAPKGSAFLYARPAVQNMIEPLIVSWGWRAEVPGTSQFIDYLEYTGTRDIAAYLSVPDAIKFLNDNNWDKVRLVSHKLAAATRLHIQSITKIEPICPDSLGWFAQMGAMTLPEGIDPEKLQVNLYTNYKIEIPMTKIKEKNFIRFSFQAYNSDKDVDLLSSALKTLI